MLKMLRILMEIMEGIIMGNVGSALLFLLSGSVLWLNHKTDDWKSLKSGIIFFAWQIWFTLVSII